MPVSERTGWFESSRCDHFVPIGKIPAARRLRSPESSRSGRAEQSWCRLGWGSVVSLLRKVRILAPGPSTVQRGRGRLPRRALQACRDRIDTDRLHQSWRVGRVGLMQRSRKPPWIGRCTVRSSRTPATNLESEPVRRAGRAWKAPRTERCGDRDLRSPPSWRANRPACRGRLLIASLRKGWGWGPPLAAIY